MAHNEIDHGLSTEAQFFLLNQEGRRYFHTSDAATEAWKPGDVIMVSEENEHIRAGRAT